MPKQFGESLSEVFDNVGQLCVGIDPHESLLIQWGLKTDASGLSEFSNRVLDACVGRVGIIKPQVSFFERLGSVGFKTLEDLVGRARENGLLVIADAKRGDIGSTMDGYLAAWLGPGSPLESDALTASPFLGSQTYLSGMNDYLAKGKGLISLVSTSNPEGQKLQGAQTEGLSTSRILWDELSAANQVTAAPGSKLGSFGAVIGATRPIDGLGLVEAGSVSTPILAPGFGAQGASLDQVRRIFGSFAGQVIASVSRSVVADGPHTIAANIDLAKVALVQGLK